MLGGARVGGKRDGEPYGTENFNGSFRQKTKTTPYSYAKSLLSVLFSLGGWYDLKLARRPEIALRQNAGKRRIMLASSLFRRWAVGAEIFQVLSEVKMPKGNPNTTFKKGVFWAFGLVSVLYLFANIAYVNYTFRSYASTINC